MKKSIASAAVLGATLTSLGFALPASPASAADPNCSAGSPKLIETIPAVTHTESQYAKTITHPAQGEPMVSVKVQDAVAEVSHTDVEYVVKNWLGEVVKTRWAHKDSGRTVFYDWELWHRTGVTQRHVEVPARDAVWEDRANPDYVPASTETLYYNGKSGGTTDPAKAAWVRYTPTGWSQVVDTKTVTDAPESYLCDFVKPVATIAPQSSLVRPGHLFTVSATDDHQVAKTVGNVYGPTGLLDSNQTSGRSLGVTVPGADGDYYLKYNALDSVGNLSTTGQHRFTVDGTAPTVSDKGQPGAAQSKSFKLFDRNKIATASVNGVDFALTDAVWTDVNDLTPGRRGAVEGTNVLTVTDLAGNTTEVTFVLDTTGPTVTDKGQPGAAQSKSFKLFDRNKIATASVNGVDFALTDAVWTDVNDLTPGRRGAVEGTNVLTVTDLAGNTTEVTFVLDTTGPVVTEKDGSSATSRSYSLDDGALGSKVAGVRINGHDHPLSANRWSDVNGVIVGNYWGALAGENTLVAYDALGNETTLTFTLDAVQPVLPEEEPDTVAEEPTESTPEVPGPSTDTSTDTSTEGGQGGQVSDASANDAAGAQPDSAESTLGEEQAEESEQDGSGSGAVRPDADPADSGEGTTSEESTPEESTDEEVAAAASGGSAPSAKQTVTQGDELPVRDHSGPAPELVEASLAAAPTHEADGKQYALLGASLLALLLGASAALIRVVRR
ncbi:hypothetical protein [Nocardioides insulae]|uniref:hypothetical protein n=1 Tax=Nocardioides insulae TaxID=394734 RepID=UPI00040D637C|nr:hypothetical protein [Nocardioides insulae]